MDGHYKYKNRGEEQIAAPFGNDFNLHVCHLNVAPGGPEGATFADVDNLQVYLVNTLGKKTRLAYTITDSGDLLIHVTSDKQKRTKYGLELIGTYGGNAWRWKASAFISIVDNACNNSLSGCEAFTPDTYYLDDTLFVYTSDDTMIFTTEGHASLSNGTLMIQATENTSVNVENDTLIITYNDR